MKKNRVKRTKTDLRNELQDQIDLLIHACETFDSGFTSTGKHIALSLRVLIHHHGQSRALLQQLELRGKQFLDTAGELNPRNLLTENPLCFMRVGGGKDSYLPKCNGGLPYERWLPFAKWWNNPIIRDDQRRTFNRRELVLNVADTDGGAHVDPDLDESYMDLSRNNSLGWVISNGDVTKPFPPPTMPCIRQIAHEVLETLKVKARSDVRVSYTAQQGAAGDG